MKLINYSPILIKENIKKSRLTGRDLHGHFKPMTHQSHLNNSNNTANAGSGSQLLALGLFIMLLAFFIVLTTLSTFDDEQAAPVLASLEKAFAPRVYRQDVAQTTIAAPAESNNQGTSLERIAGLFRTRIPGTEFHMERSGISHVAVKTADLLDAIENPPTSNDSNNAKNLGFRDIFVAVLMSQKTAAPLRLDVLINLPKNPADKKDAQKNLTAKQIQKTAKIAGMLQRQGLPLYLYSFSYGKGPKGMTDITFRPYEPYSPSKPSNVVNEMVGP